MTEFDLEKKKEEAQIYQAIMMAKFKETEEYKFLVNVAEALKIGWRKDRQKAMKTQGQREMCLYITGKEDCVSDFFEMIDQTIVDGEQIRDFKLRQQEAKEG